MRKTFGVAVFGTGPAPSIVRQVQLAEELGFDSAWIVDSQLLCREAYVTLAACAVQTSRIKLATGVTNPLTRHPSVVAGAAITLDELSNGRMMVGISTGNSAVRPVGLKPATVAELEQYVSVLIRLLRNEPAQFSAGAQGKINWLEKPTGIPVYVAATNPKLTHAAGRFADGAILFQGISPELIHRGVQHVTTGALESQRNPDEVDVACWIPLSVSSDGRLARDNIRGRVAAVLKYSRLDTFTGRDREVVKRLKQEYDYFEHTSSKARHAELVSDEMVDRYALAGTPREVREKLEQLMRLPGFSKIIVQPEVSDGELSPEIVLRTFVESVLSRIV